MRGPAPKNPAIRARRNKAATRATLPAAGRRGRVPPLPDHRKRWHPQTVKAWDAFWRSPMATQVLPADRETALAVAVEELERYWKRKAKATDVLKLWQGVGWDPLSRRRLEWTIDEPEARRGPDPAVTEPTHDPRDVLRMVK